MRHKRLIKLHTFKLEFSQVIKFFGIPNKPKIKIQLSMNGDAIASITSRDMRLRDQNYAMRNLDTFHDRLKNQRIVSLESCATLNNSDSFANKTNNK